MSNRVSGLTRLRSVAMCKTCIHLSNCTEKVVQTVEDGNELTAKEAWCDIVVECLYERASSSA